MSFLRFFLAVGVALASASCGDDGGTAPDGSLPADGGGADGAIPDGSAPDATVDGGAPMQCGGDACSILTGAGCPAGQGCYFLSTGPNTEPMAICQPTGPGADGASCAAPFACMAGYDCVPGLRVCRKLCCIGDHSVCPSGQRCATRYIWMTSSGETRQTDGAYCSPNADCDPLAQTGCGTQACYTETTGDGTLLCAMPGDGAEGDACVALNDCARGLFCVGTAGATRCHRYCSVSTGTPCGAGQSCTTLSLPAPLDDVGMCTPPSA